VLTQTYDFTEECKFSNIRLGRRHPETKSEENVIIAHRLKKICLLSTVSQRGGLHNVAPPSHIRTHTEPSISLEINIGAVR
jgi:hypothetical protein